MILTENPLQPAQKIYSKQIDLFGISPIFPDYDSVKFLESHGIFWSPEKYYMIFRNHVGDYSSKFRRNLCPDNFALNFVFIFLLYVIITML